MDNMMDVGTQRRRGLRIATRLLLVVVLLAVTAGAAALAGIYAISVYSERVALMQRAAARAMVGERINGLVNAVVMDSRGIYIAADATEVEKFGKPLLDNLARLQSQMDAWSKLLHAGDQATLEGVRRQMRDFIILRTAMVQAARSLGAEAAKKIGNNDANRANRQALNTTIVAIAAQNETELAAVVGELEGFRSTMLTLLSVVSASGILLVVALAGQVMIFGILRPLGRVTAAMRALAGGASDIVVPDRSRPDEIGQMALALDVFRAQAIENRALGQRQIEADRKAAIGKRAALVEMAERIEVDAGLAVQSIGDRSAAVSITAQRMTELAARTGVAARLAAVASDNALGTAQVVAGAAEELSASIREISDQVTRSTAVITHAVQAGARARGTIAALDRQVGRISAMAGMISEIAARTNLLALNATIEAARAGEAGKGFAVVASEVKLLATQTAKSTEEITRHIASISGATSEAVAAVTDIDATLAEVSVIASAIAAAIKQQGAATSEIAHNVSGTAAAIHQMASRNDEVSQEATQADRYAQEVLDNTRILNGAMRDLRESIIRTIRTSTADVDRRLFERHAVNVPCRIETADGVLRDGHIIDISAGGICISGMSPIHSGIVATLHTAAIGRSMRLRAISHDGDTLRAKFEMEVGDETTLNTWLDELSPAGAA